MKKLLIAAAIAVGGYFAYEKWAVSQKRQWLIDFSAKEPVAVDAIKRMTDKEVEYVYEFLKKYAPVTGDVPQQPIPTWLQLEIQKISTKYNIFT